jgi:hypothetical protein
LFCRNRIGCHLEKLSKDQVDRLQITLFGDGNLESAYDYYEDAMNTGTLDGFYKCEDGSLRVIVVPGTGEDRVIPEADWKILETTPQYA